MTARRKMNRHKSPGDSDNGEVSLVDRALRLFENPIGALIVLLILVVFWAALWRYLDDSQKLEQSLTALAILVGGVWVLYQFVLRRSFESALSMTVTASVRCVRPAINVVTLEISLTNSGPRRITVPRELSNREIAEYENSVRYPGDLQIALLPIPSPAASVGWWTDNKPIATVAGIPEHVSFLYEYSDANGKIDFFLEPGECYMFSPVFALMPGEYLAKVVFIGDRRGAYEYWSRIIHFHVPDERGERAS